MADSNNSELIGFIGGRFEALNERFESLSDRLDGIEQRMATKEDLARLDGRFSERLEVATTSIRGDIEQVHLRLDSMEHRNRFQGTSISMLKSAVCAALSTSLAKIVQMFCDFSVTKPPNYKK